RREGARRGARQGARVTRPRLLREDPFGRRRLGVLGQPLHLVFAEREADAPLLDLRHLLGRHVLAASEQAGRDRESVEDVAARVADDLLDLADVFARGVQDFPAALDQEPGDRIGHQTTFPPAYQTGPWAAAGRTSETAWPTRTEPRIAASSRPSKPRWAV